LPLPQQEQCQRGGHETARGGRVSRFAAYPVNAAAKPFSREDEAILKQTGRYGLWWDMPDPSTETTRMLAEKFFLLLEMLKARGYPDGGPRVVSSSPHIPIKLPAAK
jgi:hypothetical protein